jgi:hypothetical protein
MTFADDTLEVAQSLGRLLAKRAADLGHDGLQVALVARSATLDLARMLHHTVGPREGRVGDTIAALESDPVAALGRLLAKQPRIEPLLSPTDVLSKNYVGDAATWSALARAAITAADAWPVGHGATLQRLDAWGVIADSAAVVEAVAVLDGDLVGVATRLEESRLAERLRTSCSGLRLAAGQVRALAAAGPLPSEPHDVAKQRRPTVRVVRDVESAIEGQRSLAGLLRSAGHVRPEHAVQIAIAHVRVVKAITAGLVNGKMKRVDDAGLAERVSALIEPLTCAASRPGRIASIHAGDARPLQQASELARYVSTNAEEAQAAPPGPLMAWASELRGSIDALSSRATRELDSRRWLVPDTADAAMSVWAPLRADLGQPVLRAAVGQAVEIASGLPIAGEEWLQAPHAPSRAPVRTVHALLGQPLAIRQTSRSALPGRCSASARRR